MKAVRIVCGVFLLAALAASAGPVSAGRLFLRTDALDYDPGETVTFFVRNDHDVAVEMPSYPYWSITEVATGIRGAGCSGLPVVHFIEPGHTEGHTWEQVMCQTGLPAAPGTYLLRVDYWLETDPPGLPMRTAGVPFCIGGGCDLPVGIEPGIADSPWGRVKAIYR